MLNLKKLGALAVAMAMGLSLMAGCGGGEKPAEEKPAAAPEEKPEGETAEAPAAPVGDEIKIGIFEPLTGANAGGGALETEGIELAHSLRPEVLGKKVTLVKADNKSEKADAAAAASRLADQEKVVAVIGSWGSSLSIAGGSVFAAAGVPAIGASCTNPQVTAGNEWYTRVCFIDKYQASVMASYAFKDLGAKTAALIIEVNNDYSVALGQFFIADFEALGGQIVANAEYNTGDQDFNAQITAVAQKNPDVIFAPGNFTESAMIIKQARQQGITQKFLGCDTWETPEFIEVGGDAVADCVFSTFFDSNSNLTPKTQVFVDAYKAAYNGAEPAAVTALGFDAYNMLLDKIEEIGSTDGTALRDAINATKDWEGATGYVTLDENGDATKAAVLKTVKDGKFTFVANVDASK